MANTTDSVNATDSAGVELDPAHDVRGEDSFDVAAVARWLRSHAEHPGGLDGVPQVRQFSGGVSNLTYLLRYHDRDLILRQPPRGAKAKSAHDMRREYDVQKLLKPVYRYVPDMVAFCDDESVIGTKFYVMQRLTGHILRRDLPAEVSLSPAQARELSLAYVDRLIDLHHIDVAATGLDRFSRGQGYVARQVSGWSGRYRRAATNTADSFETVIAWLQTHQPPDRGQCLIHNDFRLDNLVLDADNPLHVIGVLDWELATVGDPLMDLGSALAYWIEAGDDAAAAQFRQQPSNVAGMLTRAEIVEHYAATTGLTVTPQQWLFYEVFGLFRLAVIAQQVYYRFQRGDTTNTAYQPLRQVVEVLEERCHSLIGDHTTTIQEAVFDDQS